MKVEIWSDVMCPFCYIGKRHFEQAIDKLPFKNEIEVDWKSYQLNPEYHNTDNETIYDYLSRSKGMSVEHAKQMTQQVVDMAANAGLTINFDKNIPANTFNAHRLIHLAAKHNLQDVAEEKLFEAHFVQGKNIGEDAVLIEVAKEIGLDATETTAALASDQYAEAVRYDIYESQNLGIRGVPYFVMDRKYGVSGAQPVQAFTDALTQSFQEWKASQPQSTLTSLNKNNDAICDENGCEI
ncbi:DsbA family oxidoreductase [Pedobacter rhizosphaerae]|uniref:Protein disulfide-isomerase n=1 Tax=Pedobacter rhizosphaerae TaxID=390241 RepID=A0A1H9IUK6_9SPHI|nr:DsbA family oxidoreductase [Pedobacter rhizosphaerae]SEQ78219.1 protein disulfide-isomerase [Pedobacter rhizosphaerae]